MRPGSKPLDSPMRGQFESPAQRPVADEGSGFTNRQLARGMTVGLSHTSLRTVSCADASLKSTGGYFGTSVTLASAAGASTLKVAEMVSMIGAPFFVAIGGLMLSSGSGPTSNSQPTDTSVKPLRINRPSPKCSGEEGSSDACARLNVPNRPLLPRFEISNRTEPDARAGSFGVRMKRSAENST